MKAAVFSARRLGIGSRAQSRGSFMRLNALASAALCCGIILAGCAHKAPPPTATLSGGEQVTLTRGTWNAYINYKQWLMPKSYTGPVGDGYFAVTKDGHGWGLAGCPDASCDLGSLDPNQAIRECSVRNGNAPCLVFAHQDKIVVPYQIGQ
jgi:hypothetical protein